MANILIMSGHPRSDDDALANKTVLEEVTRLLPAAQIDRLDAPYPDYMIDVEAEQVELKAADVIVLQHPLRWYGFLSLLAKWMEDVFLHGFSHGSKGRALRGKKLVVFVTVGAPQAFYRADEGGLERFLAHVEVTCALTGMEYAGSVCTYGVPYLNRGDEAARSDMVERSREHAAHLVRFVEGLSVGPAAD